MDEKLNFEFISKNLKYEDRVIIILYYMKKYTDKEISEILKSYVYLIVELALLTIYELIGLTIIKITLIITVIVMIL